MSVIQNMQGIENPNRVELQPFLKWAGGKRWFVYLHRNLFPREYNHYIEPFLGAGSVFFHLQPAEATLGDTNADLINTYRGIRADWRRVESSLKYRQKAHSSDPNYYYQLRARNPREITQKASRLIYLNRTCFNGIYRVNRQGAFNVPRGTKDEVVLDSDAFEAMSHLLKRAKLRVSDFEPLIHNAKQGDFVFADPPYTVRHNYNGFIKYNETLFSWKDQERLADALHRASRRGVKILCTNANHDSVRDLYSRDGFNLTKVSRFSGISADSASRKQFEELVIVANI